MKDKPGTLYSLLDYFENGISVEDNERTRKLGEILTKVLSNHKDKEGSQKIKFKSQANIDDKSQVYLDIKYITVETCERFGYSEATIFDSPTNRLVSLRPRARFHAIIELKIENKKEKSVERTNDQKTERTADENSIEKKSKDDDNILSVMEITACLDRENTLKAIIGLINLLKIENVTIPSNKRGFINRYLAVAYDDVERPVSSAPYKIDNSSEVKCPKMGTCPLSRLENSPEINQSSIDMLTVKDIMYIRDHGCYTTENTLLELIGIGEYTGTQNKNDYGDIPINAVVITIHYHDLNKAEKFKFNLTRYLNNIIENWKQKNRENGRTEALYYLSSDQNGDSVKRLYLLKWTHTCEYYPCYIVRSFKPVVELSRGGGAHNENE
ncbi:hypothetical protein [Thermococcus sp.]|uniref:hypothetical protein n=2 Tax=Thermococcus sp. TaxID=35749 RepID=UPI0025F1F81B|nr:hypothetical protein [Thermococcus sp.]